MCPLTKKEYSLRLRRTFASNENTVLVTVFREASLGFQLQYTGASNSASTHRPSLGMSCSMPSSYKKEYFWVYRKPRRTALPLCVNIGQKHHCLQSIQIYSRFRALLQAFRALKSSIAPENNQWRWTPYFFKHGQKTACIPSWQRHIAQRGACRPHNYHRFSRQGYRVRRLAGSQKTQGDEDSRSSHLSSGRRLIPTGCSRRRTQKGLAHKEALEGWHPEGYHHPQKWQEYQFRNTCETSAFACNRT